MHLISATNVFHAQPESGNQYRWHQRAISVFSQNSLHMLWLLRPQNSTNGIYPGLIYSKFNLKRVNLELGPAWRINSLAFSNGMYNITSDDYIWKFLLVVAGILSMPTGSRYILISVIGKPFLTIIFSLAKKRNCIQFPNQANCTMTNYSTLKCF